MKFLSSQKDRFANPVGYTISSSAGAIFDELIGEGDFLVTELLLKDVVRIRAVQEFSPSQAIRFVFDLKEIMRSEIENESGGKGWREEFTDIESRIDDLALVAFDTYMESREKLFKIRIDEVKARSFQTMVANGSGMNKKEGTNDE